MEDLAYRRLISAYYLNEKPLKGSAKEISRLILMRDNVADVEQVLVEFFTPNSGHNKWTNKRCDKEIKNYKSKIKKTSEAGRLSGIARKKTNKIIENQPNKSLTSVKQMLNKPDTKNLEPRTNKKIDTFSPLSRLLSLKVEQQVARDWLLIRKAKKKPLTETALNKIINQAKKGGYTLQAALTISCEEGWAGFDPSWKHSLNGGGEEKVVKVAWYASEDATQSKGIEIGCLRKDSESLGDYRERIQQQLSGVNYVR